MLGRDHVILTDAVKGPGMLFAGSPVSGHLDTVCQLERHSDKRRVGIVLKAVFERDFDRRLGLCLGGFSGHRHRLS
jgi:hypothetical protein